MIICFYSKIYLIDKLSIKIKLNVTKPDYKYFYFTGPLNTLIQVLLTTIFDLEEDEEADMKESNITGLMFLGSFESLFN